LQWHLHTSVNGAQCKVHDLTCNKLNYGLLQGVCRLSTCPPLAPHYPGGNEIKKSPTCSALPPPPPTGLPECFSADITAQRPGKPISPLLYHSPLPASCPDDVTHHMVFSSIKPEKRFSQWRGKGEKRREKEEGWNGAQVGHRKQKLSLFPLCVP